MDSNKNMCECKSAIHADVDIIGIDGLVTICGNCKMLVGYNFYQNRNISLLAVHKKVKRHLDCFDKTKKGTEFITDVFNRDLNDKRLQRKLEKIKFDEGDWAVVV